MGARYTHRFCRLISGLCRHMPISVVSKHLQIRWETVKEIDKTYLQNTLPEQDPSQLTGIRYLGVDEVARAKGHDYMTVVYDMDSGILLWVGVGRNKAVLSEFLSQLSAETVKGIEAVAMDMGRSYQAAVKECLPNADIVFDRFHIMQNFSKAIANQRRIEFRRASKPEKKLMKGSRYLLQRNRENMSSKQSQQLDTLLEENQNLSTIYLLKEQLQTLWIAPKDTREMRYRLEQWCSLARESSLVYMEKFAGFMERHTVGICNYARHPLTSARIEAGNVAIGMIRKRARGIRDTDYFKLKIQQTSIPDSGDMFYSVP